MSTYQYYEFLALDRPLTQTEQAKVRALSTHAEITATSFTNEYHWGDFKGDPGTLLERYYDAHLYYADWGTQQIMLRLPGNLLDLNTVRPYLIDDHVMARTSGDHLILDLVSEDEPDDWLEGVHDLLPAIATVRTELAAGDLRPLYLAWLAAIGTWERDEDAFDADTEDAPEPSVPPGLATLTAGQQALADFLRLDPDLLAVAQGEATQVRT